MSFAHRTGFTGEAGSQAKGEQCMRTENRTRRNQASDEIGMSWRFYARGGL